MLLAYAIHHLKALIEEIVVLKYLIAYFVSFE